MGYILDIIIETPRGSREKYIIDGKGFIQLKKSLPLGMVFPYDFGSIPGTKAQDGDAADALVISELTMPPGCRLKARLIGAMPAEQEEKGKKIRNDRFFFIPTSSSTFAHIGSVQQFAGEHNDQLRDFFINYNKSEKKTFTPLAFLEAEEAYLLLEGLRS
ncbi:MAG TPA: inorganic diphosphatase [Chitinophagaceae bacterium]|nr:inorganic diphosphatase [Chitinophagaceae bacterium]